MKDIFLKLPSEADMPAILAAFYRQDSTTVVDLETGEEHVQLEGDPYLVTATHDYSIDVVGTIYRPTGSTLTDDEGNEYPETAPLDGWHVNLRLLNDEMLAEAEALAAEYGTSPRNPAQVWA